MQDAGSRIKALREQMGMGQRELARESGVSQSTLSRIESGDREATAAEVVLLADAVGATVAEITGESYVEREATCAARAVGADVAAMQRELLVYLEVSGYLTGQGFAQA